jgi:3-hydroxyacyl-CoA dehydrogenase
MTREILLIGGGKIGEAIAVLLSDVSDFKLAVADHSEVAPTCWMPRIVVQFAGRQPENMPY